MQVWRLCSSRFPPLTGEGARLGGGRWNHKGTRMVYCAGSLALAALESFVHFDSSLLPDDFVAIAVEIPDDVAASELTASALPAGWNATPAPDTLKTVGSAWIASARTAVLCVPSAVIEHEKNFLLNPDHPDFRRLTTTSRPFRFDERMAKPPPPAKPRRARPAPKVAAATPKALAPKPRRPRPRKP